jgi:hypothetical protein
MFLRYGAQPDKKDDKGRTALWWNKYQFKRSSTQSYLDEYHPQLSSALSKIEEILKSEMT